MIRRVSPADPDRFPLSHFLFVTAEGKKISPSAIAAKIGRSLSNVCEIERGTRRASDEVLKPWAELLGVPLARLTKLAKQQEIQAIDEAAKARIARLRRAS